MPRFLVAFAIFQVFTRCLAQNYGDQAYRRWQEGIQQSSFASSSYSYAQKGEQSGNPIHATLSNSQRQSRYFVPPKVAKPPTEIATTLVRQVSVLSIVPVSYVQQQQQQYYHPQSPSHQQHIPYQSSYQYQSQNGNSQTQNQYQYQYQQRQHPITSNPSTQTYPTTTPTRATRPTTTTRMFASSTPRVTYNRDFESANREGGVEEFNTPTYNKPLSTATSTRPTFSRPIDRITSRYSPSYMPSSQAPQTYPHSSRVSTSPPQRFNERKTTQAPEYVTQQVNFEKTSPTNPLLFPDTAQQELQIVDGSRVPDYLNLNKELTTRAPLEIVKTEDDESEESVSPLRKGK